MSRLAENVWTRKLLSVPPSGYVERRIDGERASSLSALFLNGNMVARNAFEGAKRIYPQDRLVLVWGAYVP